LLHAKLCITLRPVRKSELWNVSGVMGRFGKWLWREAAAKAAIAAILFQAMLVSFCHLPTPQLAGDANAASTIQSSSGARQSSSIAGFSAIICSASGARSARDAGAFTGLPSLFHRVPPPEHQDAWSCPACFANVTAALVILAVFIFSPPAQTRPLFAAAGWVWIRSGLILHPHPTRGPPLAFA
jgi:hypothetical protein